MTDYAFILTKAHPEARWSMSGDKYSGINWLGPGPKPTKKSLDAAYIEYKRANDYKIARAKEYPKIEDQLDAILKGFNTLRFEGTNLPADLDAIIGEWLAVKAKYPKPTE